MEKDIFSNIEKEYGISAFPKDTVDAMAYVPFQQDSNIYSAQQGFVSGTMFPVLDKPFLGNEREANNEQRR